MCDEFCLRSQLALSEYLSQHSLKRDSKVNDMIAYVVTSAFYSDLIFEK